MKHTSRVLEYVVKTRHGQYWCGDAWASCNVCAQRMTRAEAHQIAHADGAERRVVRIRARSET